MRNKKRRPTRKALVHRLAALCAILILLPLLWGYYTPFPAQVVDVWEKRFDTGPLEIVRREDFDGRPAFLAGNDAAVLLTFCRYEPLLGWLGDDCWGIDRSYYQPPVYIQAQYYSTEVDGIKNGFVYDLHYFGLVETEGAAAIEVRSPESSPDDSLADSIQIPLFQGEDGRSYFWYWRDITYSRDNDLYRTPLDVDVLDQEGNILSTHHITEAY